MAAKLVLEEGEVEGVVLSLEEGEEWVIGNNPEICQLVVEDTQVRPQHVRCRSTEEGIEIEAFDEEAAVYVNEEELTEAYLLHDGDKIQMGNSLFRFEAPDLLAEETEEGTMEETSSPVDSAKTNTETEAEIEAEEETQQYDTIFDADTDTSSPEDSEFAEIHFGMMESDRFLLKVIAGPNTGAEFSMHSGAQYLIGTDGANCDLVFHDVSVSRQHLKLLVSEEGRISVEDLGSRNGVLINGQKAEGKTELTPNHLVSIGTTTFIVIDREGSTDTVMSPVVTSHSFEKEKPEEKEELRTTTLPSGDENNLESNESKKSYLEEEEEEESLSNLVFVCIVAGLFLIMGMGTALLFNKEDVVLDQGTHYSMVEEALLKFPQVRYNYNRSTGRLLVGGHVLSRFDKNQILQNLNEIGFSESDVDDSIVIDELVWQDANQQLSNDPTFRSITIHSVTPGQFIMTGQLKTRTEADRLMDFLTINFRYIDVLENRVIVEEEILDEVYSQLRNNGLGEIVAELNNGDLRLTGFASVTQQSTLNFLLDAFKEITGIKNVRNLVAQLAPEEAMVNLSEQYQVTGYSRTDDVNVSVIINGRILSRGDVIDGLTIIRISQDAVFLEKDGFKYRIDYRK